MVYEIFHYCCMMLLSLCSVCIFGLNGSEWHDGNGAGATSDAAECYAPADSAVDDALQRSVAIIDR